MDSGRPKLAVLLDYDGVVAEFDESRALSAAAGMTGWLVSPADVIWGHFYDGPRTPDLDRGHIGYREFWDDIRASVWNGPEHVFDSWVDLVTESYHLSDEMRLLLDQIGGSCQLALVTDNHRDFREWLQDRPEIGNRFSALVNSAEHGVCKPSPELFDVAVARLGVDLDDVVFVDDAQKNVDGARDLGLSAVRFRDVAQLRSDLVHWLGTEPN